MSIVINRTVIICIVVAVYRRSGVYASVICVCAARNAIIVIIASSMAAILYHNDIEKFTLTGNITSGIPPFRPPSFTLTDGNHTYSVQDFFDVSKDLLFLRAMLKHVLVI